MAREVLYPSAVDYMRTIVTNTVDNLLADKPGYVDMPSTYQRAYILARETGIVLADTDFEVATDTPKEVLVSITKDPRAKR